MAPYTRPHSNNVVLAQALAIVLVVGFFDYITGYEISFFLFYTGPILMCVWYADRKATILIVLVSAIVWWWADWKAGHPYFADWVQIWETCMRLIFFTFVAIGGTAVKQQRDSLEDRMAGMRKMRELELEIVNAGEREQQRIGQDLHDGLCQVLAGIACAAGSLRDDLSARFQPEAEAAAELHELIKESIGQARGISRGISPVHMDEAGLASGLEELAQNTARLHGIECTFLAESEILVGDRQTAIHFYRIAQEATSNAIRHGRASRVCIELGVEDADLVLKVEDNGAGLPEPLPATNGIGLRSMRYRANVLGGSFEIGPRPGGGAAVCCRAPAAPALLNDSPHAN